MGYQRRVHGELQILPKSCQTLSVIMIGYDQIQWITLTLTLLSGTANAFAVTGFNASYINTWEGYLKCATGTADKHLCASGMEELPRQMREGGDDNVEYDIVFNSTACDNGEIEREWLDEHPLLSLTDYGYAMRRLYETGAIRVGGKVGGKDAAADAEPNPTYLEYQKHGIDYAGNTCIIVREFRRFWGGFPSERANATSPIGIEHQRLMDWMYALEQEDEIESYEQWVNCISGESSEDVFARYMPMGPKYLAMIKTPLIKRQATLMYMSTGRMTTSAVMPIEMMMFDVQLILFGWFSFYSSLKRLNYDFRQMCVGNPAFSYPHKADLDIAMDQFEVDYYQYWLWLDFQYGSLMNLESHTWGVYLTESANRNDRNMSRYANGLDTPQGRTHWWPAAYINHTDLHINGRYNETTGLLMVEETWRRFPEGTLLGPDTWLDLRNGGDFVNLDYIDFGQLPWGITVSHAEMKNASMLGTSLLSLTNSIAAHTIFSPLSQTFVSTSMTEAEQIEILRNMAWNEVTDACPVNNFNGTTWVEYKQYALFISKLHLFAPCPDLLEAHGGAKMDCRYSGYIIAGVEPATYTSAGFSHEEAVVLSIAHILMDETCHALAYLYFRIVGIIAGQDFVDMFITLWHLLVGVVSLRIALFYVKISPARIGRMLDNRDKYAANFKFMREHRAAFISKSKKMGEKYLTDTLGLKIRRSLRQTTTEAQTESMKKAFTFEEGTAHFIHQTNFFLMTPAQITNNRAIRKSRKPTKDPKVYDSPAMTKTTDLIVGVITAILISLMGIFAAFMVGLLTW